MALTMPASFSDGFKGALGLDQDEFALIDNKGKLAMSSKFKSAPVLRQPVQKEVLTNGDSTYKDTGHIYFRR